jgi:serine/threonine protein kinase
MDRNEVEIGEEQLALWLARFDDALARGTDTSELFRGSTSQDQPRAKRDLDCIRALRQMWGGAKEQLLASETGETISFDAESTSSSQFEIGRFRIVRELGRGGFGVVFLAVDPNLGREVALKIPRADALVTRDLWERFQHEARAAAGLDHPNIVAVHEAGEDRGICYIASAYCPGPTLAHWLKARTEPVPFEIAAHLTATLADAVQHAHSRGVLHRDLKPSNILLAEPAQAANAEALRSDSPQAAGKLFNIPRITDFGLAKLIAETDQNQTHSGTVLGTPSFMAPEQAAGRSRDVTTAADVHGLGGILYALLTGRPPFQGESTIETLRRVELEAVSPPSQWRANVPRDLETIALKCLEKEPMRRYETAAALADDLRRYLSHEPVSARPVGKIERFGRWCRRKPAQAVLSAALLLVSLVGAAGVVSQFIRANKNYHSAEVQRSLAEERRDKAHQAIHDYFTLVSENKLLGKPGFHELRKELLETALEYYKQFLDERSDDPAMQVEVADTWSAVARIHDQIGSKDAARSAYEQALLLYQALHSISPGDSQLPRHLARTFAAVGDLDYQSGDLDAAMQSFEKARDLQAQLVRDNARDGVASDLANTHKHIALIFRRKGQNEQALGELAQARITQRQLMDSGVHSPDLASSLAETLTTIGSIQSDLVAFSDAESSFDEAIRLLEASATNASNASELQHSMWAIYREQATVFAKQAYYDSAILSDRRALEIAEKLAYENPTVTEYEWDLARSYHGLAYHLSDSKEFEEAIEALQHAIPHLKKLVRLSPDVPDYREILGACLSNTGHNHFKSGRQAEALQFFREAADVGTMLVQQFPDVPKYRRNLGVSYHNIGNESQKMGQLEAAESALMKCLANWGQLAEQFPNVPQHQLDLVRICTKLGGFHSVNAPTPKSREFFERGLEVCDRLARAHPTVPEYERMLSTSLLTLGENLREMGEFSESKRHLERALEIRERFARTHPELTDVEIDLAKSLRHLGETHMAMDDRATALDYFERARDVYDRQIRTNPNELDTHSGLGKTWDDVGLILGKQQQFDEALAAFHRAIELQRGCLDRTPQYNQYREWLSEHYSHLAQLLRELKRPDEAAANSLERQKIWPNDPNQLFSVACELAMCISTEPNNAPAPSDPAKTSFPFADRAAEVLKQAVQCGYKDRDRIANEPALAPIRQHPILQSLFGTN